MDKRPNRNRETEMPSIRRVDRQALCAIWIILSGITVLILSLFAAAFVVPAHGRDLTGQYAQSPNSEWIKSLRNKSGTPCCDVADGHRLEDVDWRGEPDGTYSVRIDGNWVKLSQDQILTEPNKIGVTMVWVYMGRVTCFLAGAGI